MAEGERNEKNNSKDSNGDFYHRRGGGGGGGGGGGASVGSGNTPLNCWQINSTMYIPQLNGSGYNNQCALPLNEIQAQIAIYRYSIPNSSSQSALNDWYLNQIKTKVGNGYTVSGWENQNYNMIY